MIIQYSQVILSTSRFQCEGLEPGIIGYVLECYPDGNFEVEFSDENGITIDVVVVTEYEIKLASSK